VVLLWWVPALWGLLAGCRIAAHLVNQRNRQSEGPDHAARDIAAAWQQLWQLLGQPEHPEDAEPGVVRNLAVGRQCALQPLLHAVRLERSSIQQLPKQRCNRAPRSILQQQCAVGDGRMQCSAARRNCAAAGLVVGPGCSQRALQAADQQLILLAIRSWIALCSSWIDQCVLYVGQRLRHGAMVLQCTVRGGRRARRMSSIAAERSATARRDAKQSSPGNRRREAATFTAFLASQVRSMLLSVATAAVLSWSCGARLAAGCLVSAISAALDQTD